MTRKPVAFWCLAITMSVLAGESLAQQEDTWTGKQVMIARDGIQLRAGSEVLAPLPLGAVLEVSNVNGQWLWFKGRRGWIDQNAVVPVDKAVEYFTTAIENSPTSQSYHHRGIAHAALGQFQKAEEDFSGAIQRDAANIPAYNERGNARRELGKLDEAIADFDEVIRQGVQHPAVFTNRGLARHDQGKYDEALPDYNAAIAIDAKFAPAWEAGGSTRQAQGNLPKAISNFRRAIELDDSFDRAHNNLAWILATTSDDQLRDATQAIQHATKACELVAYTDAGYLDTLAAAMAEAGRFDEAVKRAKEAIEKATTEQKPAIEMRLRLYEAGQTYREPAATD